MVTAAAPRQNDRHQTACAGCCGSFLGRDGRGMRYGGLD